ncbi:MAG: neutral zinc metallopeptidase [Actinomycetota bacterium]|nr:neutral zinc metallopeptidase [Actinomycetota bacterium]
MVRYDQEAAERGQKYIEDQRGSGGRRGASASAGGLPIGKVGGLAGVIIAVLVAVLGGGALNDGGGTNSGFGIGSARLDDGAQVATDVGNTGPAVDPDADTKAYMGFLMLDIQEVWTEYFEQAGLQYQETKMVLFSDAVSTGCGNATSAVGPFYCPAPGDNKIYVDLDFYDELADRFGAPGDFAQAYVIAHEVGHHIQSVTGISDEVRQAQSENPGAKNELSVRQELQADCLAGVWAFSAAKRTTAAGQPIIEQGDFSEGLGAAAAVGDDRIQASAGMTVDPHTWTHGSAEARENWFMIGFRSGDPEQSETFGVPSDQVGL